MKNKYLFVIIFLTSLQAASQGTWVQNNDFPGQGRESAVYFSIGDNGYLCAGNQDSTYFNDFWRFNPANNQWLPLADLIDSARTNSVGMRIGSKGYIGTGTTSSALTQDFFEYNPADGSWMEKVSFEGPGREKAVAFRIGNKGYIGTGADLDNYQDLWEYDPANDTTWTQKADFPGKKRLGAVGFGIGNRGYIGLGFDAVGDYRKDFYEYNPSNNNWVRIQEDFPGLGREDAVSFGIDELGTGYVLCGYFRFNSYLSDCWQFDKATKKWSRLANFTGGGRKSAVGFAIDNTIYLGMGLDSLGNYPIDLWSYQIPTGINAINDDFSRIFPNPVYDWLSVEINTDEAILSLYDMEGRKVNVTGVTRGENILSLRSLQEGSYIYEIRGIIDNKMSFGKIVKME